MLGLLHELLQRGDVPGEVAFSQDEMDRRSGETLAAYVGLGIIRQPDTSSGESWRVDLDALAGWLARSLGTRCGSSVIVAGRLWFLGMLRHCQEVRELFLARGLPWRDGGTVIRQSSRLLVSSCPAVLVFSEMPPLSLWQDCRPAVASLREIAYLQGCQLLVDYDILFNLPRVPARRKREPTQTISSPSLDLELLLTQAELDILRTFAAEPGRCMTLADVMAAGGYGKDATSRSLRRLRERNLIAKPPGTSRKGDSITIAGASFLDGRNRD